MNKHKTVLIAILFLLSCTNKNPDPPINLTAPVQQPSAADMVKGSYSGTAQRWYAPSVSSCIYSPSSVSSYTKTGSALIVVDKLTDSTVSVIVKSSTNNFQTFPSSSIFSAKVFKSGSDVKVDQNTLGRGNVLYGYPYGGISLNFPTTSSITGNLDFTYSTFSNSCINYYAMLDGVSFSGTK